MIKRACGNCIYWSPNKQEHKKCIECSAHQRTDRPNFAPREAKCPMCDAGMIYNKRDAFLRCPDCGTEIWPFVGGGTTKQFVREEFEKNLDCARDSQVGTAVIHAKSQIKSGSKSKSKRNKGLMQKPSQKELYNRLSFTCKPI